MFRSIRIAPFCVAVVLAGALAGCSAKDGASKSPSQVAVKVNKEEISVHQINGLLARGGNVPQDQIKNATAAAVERLISQELLLQQAKEHKLDRDPRVLQMLEFSRREILARAYGDQVAGAAPHPTDAQISAFYNENPALFAKRRVFNLQEINITAPAERIEEIQTRLESRGSLQQLVDWLKEEGIQFAVSAGTKAAEQLPAEVLKNIAQMNPGQAFATRTPTGVVLVSIGSVRDEPIDRVRAKPFIENYLFGQARSEKVKEEIKRLREAASIEYVGDFAPPAAVAADAQTAAPEGQEAAAAVKPEDDKDGEDAVRSIIEQGAAKLR
jgi:EpsD family peptidyl-prolyl cis-trans isomerase